MANVFEVVAERVAAVLALSAAREMEADALARDGERLAGLLRQANAYQAEGFTDLAADLRRRAGAVDGPRPPVEAQAHPPASVLVNGAAPEKALPTVNGDSVAPSKKKTK